MIHPLSRRDVVKTLLVTSAYSLTENKLWAKKIVSEVEIAKDLDPDVGTARITLAPFTALNNNGGSVRLGSSAISGGIPVGFPVYPVIINRVSATEYVALESACTHEGTVVNAFSGTVASGRMTCPNHNSQFDIRGIVRMGPAGQNLLSYPTTLSNGVLSFRIRQPEYAFNTRQTMVLNGAEKRLELSWLSTAGVEYEVRHRPNFATEPVRVNMATSLAGPVTALFRTGNDTVQKCWVVPQDGYYQIAIRLRVV